VSLSFDYSDDGWPSIPLHLLIRTNYTDWALLVCLVLGTLFLASILHLGAFSCTSLDCSIESSSRFSFEASFTAYLCWRLLLPFWAWLFLVIFFLELRVSFCCFGSTRWGFLSSVFQGKWGKFGIWLHVAIISMTAFASLSPMCGFCFLHC
jgi:hypothetical protein